MSISFGGLGIMSLRQPFSDLVGVVFSTGDIRSLLCLIVFCIVFVVLAYLTNPSENSFRSYLTEQSFRQHLSRLDDAVEDQDIQTKVNSSMPCGHSTSPSNQSTISFDNRSPFHFASRASISLRTPKHVFHNFGIFTIAAMAPLSKHDRRTQPRSELDGTMISDSWFIGAFGRWWRGGILEAWYQDVISGSSDAESWSSGILRMKTLDSCNNEFNALPGLPYSIRNLPPHGLSRGSPPRLRNRDKSTQRTLSTRSTTPPPLPKSASLPLHSSRSPRPHTDRLSVATLSDTQPSPTVVDPSSYASPIVPPAPNLFDQSPHVIELLKQISQRKATVLDLRSQLGEYQSSSAQSHSSLKGELDMCRERKRQEDAAQKELKTRTKTLEDSKRSTEATKRDTEKRLRAAQIARDDATKRMESLDLQIHALQDRLVDDECAIHQMQQRVSETETDLRQALEQKRREIKVAEDIIVALNTRTRDLEDMLATQRGRLDRARENALNRFQVQLENTLIPGPDNRTPDSPVSTLTQELLHSSTDDLTSTVSFRPIGRDGLSDDLAQLLIPSKQGHLLLAGISNFNGDMPIGLPLLRTNGHPIFEDDIAHGNVPSTFAPFAETPATSPTVMLSPSSNSLIPTGLISSLDQGEIISMSFKSDSDVMMDKDWRNKSTHSDPPGPASPRDRSPGYSTTASPVSPHPPASSEGHDLFEHRLREQQHFLHNSDNAMDSQRAFMHRHNSDPSKGYVPEGGDQYMEKPINKRWFSVSKPKATRNGLNPDAKVFSFSHKSQEAKSTIGLGIGNGVSYDALNPNGLGSRITPSTAGNNSLLRAFAPSPAEREALQRALGGSTNTSLERLPSLSDVGVASVPSSPSHVHIAAGRTQPDKDFRRSIPSWLQTLPRIRKPNFSPWDDDEVTLKSPDEGKCVL